jgi:hypothetical protein
VLIYKISKMADTVGRRGRNQAEQARLLPASDRRPVGPHGNGHAGGLRQLRVPGLLSLRVSDLSS